MGDEKGANHRGSGIRALSEKEKDARRRSCKEGERESTTNQNVGKKLEPTAGKKLGKANTLVMRSLDQLARKYTGPPDETSGLLQELLDNHVGFMLFSNHLHAEYSSENIQFWEAARDFPHHPSLKECHRIVHLYIIEGSEFQINISQAVRQQVLEETEQLGITEPGDTVWKSKRDLFELAKAEIFNLMHRDSFPRFRRSQLYRVFKKKQAMDQALETRSEAKRRVENPCKFFQCGREAKHNGFCDEHVKAPSSKALTRQVLLEQIKDSYVLKAPPLQEILDHPLGSCFFAHHCAVEVAAAGEVRLRGAKTASDESKATMNPQYYYNCYKLIAEFKQTPTFNTASLCVANHLEAGAPCPVEINTPLRTRILSVIEPLRKQARDITGDSLTVTTAAGTTTTATSSTTGSSSPVHNRTKQGLDVDPFSSVPAPSADIFDEVAKQVLVALAEVYTRFLSSPAWELAKAEMENWDVSTSVSVD